MSTELIHQLIPKYNSTGKRYVLRWYEHNEGNHVIVAKTEAEVISTWQAILYKEPDAIPKEYREVEVVTPPQYIAETYAINKAAEEFDGFKYWFFGLVRHYERLHSEMPPYVKNCPGFEPDKPRKSKEEYDEYHFNCKNCQEMKYVLDGTTLQELFSKNKKLYRVNNSSSSSLMRDRKVLEGLTPNKDRKLYEAVLDGGHHQPGVVLRLVSDDSEGHSNILFYFHGEQKPIPAEVLKLVDENDEFYKQKEIRKKAQDKAVVRAEDKRQSNLLLHVLRVSNG